MAWKKIEPEGGNTWNYQEDPNFEGTFKRMEENVGPNKSNLYHFELENGEEMGVWGSTVIDTRFKNLVEGERVRIKYLGQVKGKGPRPYHNFEIYHWVEDFPDTTPAKEDVDPDSVPF